MKLSKKKVLVTGAGGFIGSHLTEELVKRDNRVKAFIRYNSRNDRGLLEVLPEDIKSEIEYFAGDLKDPEAVRKAVRGCEVIFHLGAVIAIPYSYINPLDFVQTNVVGTANVLNAALEYNVKKVVHTSTSEVYGTARYTPIDENHPEQGQSPYSASKIGADKLAESYYRSFDLPVSIIRPFNTYGPRQSARAVVPNIIIHVLTNNKIKLGNLYPTRDLTYVKDTVSAFIKVAESEDTVGEIINIGSGKEISIKDLAEKIIELIGCNAEIVIDKQRIRPEKSEVERLICDNSKAKKLINWEPQYTLEDGLKETIQWFKTEINRYKVSEYNV